jgi:valyl-tRNA synthetase
VESQAELVKSLAGIGELEIAPPEAGSSSGSPAAGPAGSIGLTGGRAGDGTDFEAFVFIAGAVDLGALGQKFGREMEKDRKFAASLKARLGNEKFLQNAPAELVAGEKLKLEEAARLVERLGSNLRDLR